MNGRNYVVTEERLNQEMNIVTEAYNKNNNLSELKLVSESNDSEMILWLINKLHK